MDVALPTGKTSHHSIGIIKVSNLVNRREEES